MTRPTRPIGVAMVAAFVGAVLLAVSPFLLWATLDFQVATYSETGMDSGYGWITLVLGLAVAGLVVAWWAGAPSRFVRLGWLVLGLGAAALTVYELIQVRDSVRDLFSDVPAELGDLGVEDFVGRTFGPGLFVALAGAAATLVAAAVGPRRQGEQAPTA